jgi:excisionase family DNA binding protein
MATQTNSPENVRQVLYKPKSIAAMWDMSLSQVYKLIAAGQLEAVNVGRSKRVPREAAERFLRAAGVNAEAR